ncbi:acetyltransferase [Lacticaseibacillus casei]|nr:acetyltransferase [Lacticaseibacillus casei]PTU93332.1 acetyltransferase [Lacticaseibacillus casei]PTU93576.1 acetyltransferase [Lacticaseibacillus casei]RXS57114.1 acetyltransferase [Lacticaseibacillus casei]TLF31732.1 acetyltransferase [Lacticaseibacillus casei]
MAQKLACKGLGRDDLSPGPSPKATYTPASNRASSRSCSESRCLLCRTILL